MEYYEKLALFFKSKGVSQIGVGQKLGYSKASMSKFLNGNSAIDSNFITKLVKEFPDIDLNTVFSEEEEFPNMMMEPPTLYHLNRDTVDQELEIILEKLTNVKNVLAQKRHNK